MKGRGLTGNGGLVVCVFVLHDKHKPLDEVEETGLHFMKAWKNNYVLSWWVIAQQSSSLQSAADSPSCDLLFCSISVCSCLSALGLANAFALSVFTS